MQILCGTTAPTVVGYQEAATCPAGKYIAIAPSFLGVGKDLTVKDLKFLKGGATEVTFANLQVQFCDEIGGTAAISEENMYDFFVAKGYDTDALEDLYGEDLAFCFRTSNQHWYLVIDGDNDFEYGFIMDDYAIPTGTGLFMYAMDSLVGGGKAQFAGQVGTEPVKVHCNADKFFLTGNIAPKGLTVGDFAFEKAKDGAEISFANIQFQYVDDFGGTQAITEENMLAFFQKKGYDTEALEDLYGEDLAFCFRTSNQHWYLVIDGDCDFDYGFIMDDYEIPAAMGLKLYASGSLTGGGYMILPPAIEKGE